MSNDKLSIFVSAENSLQVNGMPGYVIRIRGVIVSVPALSPSPGGPIPVSLGGFEDNTVAGNSPSSSGSYPVYITSSTTSSETITLDFGPEGILAAGPNMNVGVDANPPGGPYSPGPSITAYGEYIKV